MMTAIDAAIIPPLFTWSTPATWSNGFTPNPWRVAHREAAAQLGARLTGFRDVCAESWSLNAPESPEAIYVSLHGGPGDNTAERVATLSQAFKSAGYKVRANKYRVIVLDPQGFVAR